MQKHTRCISVLCIYRRTSKLLAQTNNASIDVTSSNLLNTTSLDGGNSASHVYEDHTESKCLRVLNGRKRQYADKQTKTKQNKGKTEPCDTLHPDVFYLETEQAMKLVSVLF